MVKKYLLLLTLLGGNAAFISFKDNYICKNYLKSPDKADEAHFLS